MALLPYPTHPPSQGTIKSCAAAMSAVTVVQSMKSSAKDSIKGPSMELPQPQHPLSIRSCIFTYIHKKKWPILRACRPKKTLHTCFSAFKWWWKSWAFWPKKIPQVRSTQPSKFWWWCFCGSHLYHNLWIFMIHVADGPNHPTQGWIEPESKQRMGMLSFIFLAEITH